MKRIIAALLAGLCLFALVGCSAGSKADSAAPKDYSQIIHDARTDEDNEYDMIFTKEIAEQISLTSPAVSSRIHKLETDGIISGYTVTLNRPADRVYVDALISLSVAPSKQDAFLELLQNSKEVLQCYHVTGAYTFLVKVSCGSMPQLEHLILQFQKLGTTSTQIILSTPVNHGELDALML